MLLTSRLDQSFLQNYDFVQTIKTDTGILVVGATCKCNFLYELRTCIAQNNYEGPMHVCTDVPSTPPTRR